MTSESVLDFYNDIAGAYHMLYADWHAEVRRQAGVLGTLVTRVLGRRPATLLDCTCGIGTQAIAMALAGAEVQATDLSPKAIERALSEARGFGVSIEGAVADLRTLDQVVTKTFDAVISFDNSLPHLVDDRDLALATRQIRNCVAPGGIFLASIRDYDALVNNVARPAGVIRQELPGEYPQTPVDLPAATLPRVFDVEGDRRIVFQVWDWAKDRKSYAVNQYFVVREAARDEWRTLHSVTRFRALLREELGGVLADAGFRDITWHMPEHSGFYQPVVSARG